MDQGNEKPVKCKLICQYPLKKACPPRRHMRQVRLIFKSYQIDKVISNNHKNLRYFGTTIAFFLYKTAQRI
jgi:hypothetical protein